MTLAGWALRRRGIDPAGGVRDRGRVHSVPGQDERLRRHGSDRALVRAEPGRVRRLLRSRRAGSPRRTMKPRPSHDPSHAHGEHGRGGREGASMRPGRSSGRGSSTGCRSGRRRCARRGQCARASQPALSIPLGVHIDNLAVIMFLMVTFIATLDPHLLDRLHARRSRATRGSSPTCRSSASRCSGWWRRPTSS